jgi:cell division protein FtsI/penicillin-binding protein 2
MTRCVRIPATRGPILDRHGVTLAANVGRDDVWVVPGIVDTASLERIAALAALPTARVIARSAARRSGPTVTVATVSAAAGRRVSAAHLPGVVVVASARRHYPYGTLLGPVLGWAGVATPPDMRRWPDVGLGEVVGRAGIEQQYDPVLRGTDGEQCVYVNPAGTSVALAPSVAPIPGAPLRLTIDLGLQRKLTSELHASLGPGADLGAGVSIDPRDGQVLAMASLPSYDDNLFGPPVNDAALAALYRRPGHPMLQHVTQVEAPPGSTFKLAVAAAAMVHRVLPPDEVVPTGGSWTLAGHTFHNWSVLPPQDLTQAIAWSNDVYFYKLAWALGPAAMISTAQRLGVGRTSGIDLPGEYHGFLGTPSTVHQVGGTWYPGSTVLLGIGQGYLTVTPLQDALWTAAVSTGTLVTPHLGLAVGSRSGRFAALHWPAPRRLPFAGKLGPVRAGMRAAVTSGTASLLASLPAPAGGKTGTAEDPTAPGAGTDSWLSAVVPLHAPAIETTVFLHGGSGHEDSTPPVQATLAYFLAHEKAVLAG